MFPSPRWTPHGEAGDRIWSLSPEANVDQHGSKNLLFPAAQSSTQVRPWTTLSCVMAMRVTMSNSCRQQAQLQVQVQVARRILPAAPRPLVSTTKSRARAA